MNNQKGFTPILVVMLLAIGLLVFLTQTKNTQISESKYKVAVKIGGDAITGGNLWIMNPNGTSKKQITKNNVIYSIHGWSPNNKMILISQGKNISVVEVATGNIQALEESECLLGQYQWLSDDQILAIEPQCRDGTTNKVEVFSLKGNKIRTLLTWPKDIPELEDAYGESTLKFSPELKWLAFDEKPCCEGPMFEPRLYVYNLENKSKKIILEGQDLTLHGWLQNKIIFTRNGNEIWTINSDGLEQSKILEDNDLIEHVNNPGRISNLQVSKDGTYLLYCREVGWVQCYLSHYTSGQKTMIVKQIFNDRPNYVSLSPDNSFIVYTQRSGTHDETKEPIVCFSRFVKDDNPIKLTTERCDYPKISN
ncbi:MAG: hypothetical protein HYW45_01490 [Candidatus Daviesbacteria bacterium]|nr:MAG: hypothetical protein HYW45_01490 [Candidatus Daviesbacteria bacterium]